MSKEVDVVLTDEMKKRLKEAGALGFQLSNEFPYVPGAYKVKDDDGNYITPQSLWPIFTLKELNGVELAKIEDLVRGQTSFENGIGYIKTEAGKARLKTLQIGLVTWKNFRDHNGKLIPKPTKNPLGTGVSEYSLRVITPLLQVELVNAIEEKLELTEDELLGLE